MHPIKWDRMLPFSTVPIPSLDGHRLWCYPQILAETASLDPPDQTSAPIGANR